MTIRKKIWITCFGIFLVFLCFFALRPISVSADTAVLNLGVATSGQAIYGESLQTGTISLQAEISAGEAENVRIGFMRSANTTPSADDDVRGLIFIFYTESDSTFMDVKSVELRTTKTLLKGYALNDSTFSLSVVKVAKGYKMFVDGERIIHNYKDVLDSVNTANFALLSKTNLAVNADGNATVTISNLSSDETADATESGEWFTKTEAVATDASGAITLDNMSASLSTGYNLAYTKVEVAVQSTEGAVTSLSLATAPFAPLFLDDARGMNKGLIVRFSRLNSGTYADIAFYNGNETEALCSEKYLGETIDFVLELKKKQSIVGFALLINGERMLKDGYDILCDMEKELLGTFVTTELTATYLSFGVENGSASVCSVSSLSYDPEPIANDKTIINSSEYGLRASDWSGNAVVDENGVMYSYAATNLNDALELEYVGFTLGFAYLADTTVNDCYVAFGLASQPADTSVLPEKNKTCNSIFFLLKKTSNTVYISGYSRYNGTLKNILPWQALGGVYAENEFQIEFVYYDYDLTLYINGESVKTSYGANPLEMYYSLYYENADYKTYLCFANYVFQNSEKPTLTAENCAKYRVYNIENELPEKYIASSLTANKSENIVNQPFEAKNVVVPALITFAGFVVLGVFVFGIRRSSKTKKNGR